MRMQRVVYSAFHTGAKPRVVRTFFWLRFKPSLTPLVQLFWLSLTPLSLPEENEASFLPFPARGSTRQALLAGRRIS